MVMNTLLRAAGDATYRLGLGPRPSDVPDHTLVELVEGPARDEAHEDEHDRRHDEERGEDRQESFDDVTNHGG